jgi:DNA-3-methyladenine glycosylase II
MEEIEYSNALRHFKKHDPVLYKMSKQVVVTLPPSKKQSTYFQELCESIVSQQLSVKAAHTIWLRFAELITDITPRQLLILSEQDLRSVGLSRQKITYLRALSEEVTSGRLRFNNFKNASDEEIIDQLCQVKGIGRWTAEMFLLFTLGRRDVFSHGDLGLRNAVIKLYGQAMTSEDMLAVSNVWSPHRSIASLILWSSLDNKPRD